MLSLFDSINKKDVKYIIQSQIQPMIKPSYLGRVSLVFVILVGFKAIQGGSSVQRRKYEHQRWQEQDRKLSQITDVTWNYCDVKCTYLQVIFPVHDFVIIFFKGKQTNEQFGVCYIKINETYFIWDQLVQNDFYSRTCGDQQGIDYLKHQDKYQMVSLMAIGKGTELPINYTPFRSNIDNLTQNNFKMP